MGRFINGDEVILIGEAVDGWYSVESKDGAVKGYCSADYIVKGGKVNTTVDLPSDEEFAIVDKKLSITSGVLNGVTFKTTAKDLIGSFKGNVSIVSASGKLLGDSDFVGTGCKVLVTEKGSTYTVATVLILGDVDGDGNIGTYDYLYVKRYFTGTLKLEGIYLKAALLSGHDKVTVADYVLIKRLCFGTYKLPTA
jgi:hypothetical protein